MKENNSLFLDGGKCCLFLFSAIATCINPDARMSTLYKIQNNHYRSMSIGRAFCPFSLFASVALSHRPAAAQEQTRVVCHFAPGQSKVSTPAASAIAAICIPLGARICDDALSKHELVQTLAYTHLSLCTLIRQRRHHHNNNIALPAQQQRGCCRQPFKVSKPPRRLSE